MPWDKSEGRTIATFSPRRGSRPNVIDVHPLGGINPRLDQNPHWGRHFPVQSVAKTTYRDILKGGLRRTASTS